MSELWKFGDLQKHITSIISEAVTKITQLKQENLQLKRENEQLKQDIETLLKHEEYQEQHMDILYEEIDALRDMLRKCNPNTFNGLCYFCSFSSKPHNIDGHADDCEYITKTRR